MAKPRKLGAVGLQKLVEWQTKVKMEGPVLHPSLMEAYRKAVVRTGRSAPRLQS